jgi:hypothetical protein
MLVDGIIGFEKGVLAGIGGRILAARDPVGHVIGRPLVGHNQLIKSSHAAF